MSVGFETFTHSLILSSEEKVGATLLSDLGNAFSVTLNNPISIPRSAIKCELSTVAATITYTTPNIEARLLNNIFTITHSGSGPHTITIPDGLYGLNELAATLSREFVELGFPADLLSWGSDNATQRVIVTFNYAGTQIDFTVPNSVNTILGYDALLYPQFVPSTAGETAIAPNVANFNTLTRYLIACDLVDEGIPINATGQSIIASVPITESPGSTINWQPFFPIPVNARGLIGNPRNTVIVRLLDQNGDDVDTLGESWNCQIQIKYDIPIKPTGTGSHPRSMNHH